jgi:hypothetical protein
VNSDQLSVGGSTISHRLQEQTDDGQLTTGNFGRREQSRREMGAGLENGNANANLSGKDLDRKFWAAMAMFAVLALLAWFTMGDGFVLVHGRPVELRLVPLMVIGGLALRTVLARQAEKIRRSGEKD